MKVNDGEVPSPRDVVIISLSSACQLLRTVFSDAELLKYSPRIAEVPITLHPDGRKAHRSHLRTFRDGWRTLRFYLLCSPRWLFLIPGGLLIALGLVAYGLALPGVTVMGAKLDAHTLVFGSLFILMGFQAVTFALLAKTYAMADGLLPMDSRVEKFYRIIPLERGLILAVELAKRAGNATRPNPRVGAILVKGGKFLKEDSR